MTKPSKMMLITIVLTGGLFSQTATAPTGTGTAEDPYLIASLENLYWIADQVNNYSNYFSGKYLKQTADIDASATSGWNGGAGWTPIGNSTRSFLGTYDGQGHIVSGIYISRSSTDYQGLFGYIYTATIQNLGVTDVNITGYSYVGGLAGKVVTNCTISNCYSTGSITGNYRYAGGLVGQNYNSSTINNSYSTVNVTGDQYVGGLAGDSYYNSSSINNCYSTGSVTGSFGVGGLVALNELSSTISNSYSTGSVSGSSYAGGLVGYNSSTVSNSFWDTETSGMTTSAGGTGKTTAEMKDYTTFTAAGWDFVSETANGTNDYWDVDQTGTVNSGYMILAWQNGADTSLPVELAAFTVTANDGVVVLTWTTESEIENLGFIIERSTKGTEQSDWVEIANYQSNPALQGHGSTSTRHEYQYRDKTVLPGMTYAYRLVDVDYRGNVTRHKSVEITVRAALANSLTEFVLRRAYPNPFNPVTTIRYELPEVCNITLAIYDLSGRMVTKWTMEQEQPGYKQIIWNGRDQDGRLVPSGLYIYRFKARSVESAKHFNGSRKMVLIR